VPLETPARIVSELAERGYNADREAVTLLADAPDPEAALDRAVETASDDTVVLSADQVRDSLGRTESTDSFPADAAESSPDATGSTPTNPPSFSTGDTAENSHDTGGGSPLETGGSDGSQSAGSDRVGSEPEIAGDMTGTSTGTGAYRDFVAVFRDRYETLADQLRGRVNHRPTDALAEMSPGSEAAIIGMVDGIRTTSGGHWLIEIEDTNGTFPCLVMKDRDVAPAARELLGDEVVAVEGTLADDGELLFVDTLAFPDVPHTNTPSTADRPVRAALVSDVHVGSQEFRADAWERFADWLHTDEAADVEYLLLAGDMVEGVGVYPGQDEELTIVDIYEQYEQFSEHLKSVPGDIEIVMIPGNHDAVRLAEPQPAFDEELRSIMSAHDARITSNPSTVTVEGVSVLMYHGVSLDEVIAELPDDRASYGRPHEAMYQLLRKRHVAPKYGGHTRLAPEREDHLVIEEVPDVFHAGHVHKLGYGKYHGVLTINSGCWQSQTDFQESVNLVPDVGYAPVVDLDTLDLTLRKFV
jgi:DNA polymerase II small subunit